ncbi:hypothetical protein M9Y10_009537 [Tritrichomonas musculus]|uniref:Surface antigen BspA-like n=1 Tax=Tritrichomonas musculus TaxID=1915356 RepID=A0ABR2IQE3_9EUKA
MVPSKNQRLKLCEDCTLYGKSDENLDDFDTILIGNKYDYNSKVTIPANIKYIYPYSFSGAKIKEIEILPNSKLLCIGDEAYKGSIASFTFPKNIIKIGRGLNIQKVIFECGSKLSLFRYMYVYEGSVTILSDLRPYIIALFKKYNGERLINFIVPSENKRYKSLDNLILYKSKEDSDDFDVLLSASNTSSLKIPSSIKYIFPYCFFKCNLQKIEFPEDSQLLSIGEHAFEEVPIETIKIPPHVTEIGDYAFKFCSKLINVVFPNNSELRSIGREAFYLTSITSITIPQHVTEIGDSAFYNTSKKINVVFPNNSELR